MKTIDQTITDSTNNVTSDTASSTDSRGDQPVMDYPNTFEGPEKNLEVDLVPACDGADPRGLRALSRAQIDALLDAAKCTILSHVSNAHLDAYVLSESSLFVYPRKMLIKTCGTTTLLKALPLLTEYVRDLGFAVEKVRYSRKNFLLPDDQLFPHTSFASEVDYLNDFFPNGAAHILGPINADHWFAYAWDVHEHGEPVTKPSVGVKEHTVHILMQDMHEDAAAAFFKRDNGWDGAAMSEKSGIRDLAPDAIMDAFAFEPCGYSMNAIDGPSYSTIHITPESHCSYASYETNDMVGAYGPLIQDVVGVFRPAKFTVTMSVVGELTMKDHIFKKKDFNGYKRRGGWTQAHMDGDITVLKANFALVN
ncbi:adenosylmethionine decarboxylase [Saprolegnia diclina VS20]|uniref:S-adenosylmethionine decarboxylase proenzyme n=1 Tax=Saprolegnia diclina (strain VS20) TaxID=1156394 RepID=T0REK4_SAPDV|nr:adenosylmethionine decarboxylase [Saprolegnia diclina VS20]EQC28022.1 adenosylmethionine decarboxylase [Saprolegnia diclina VS20]|eukprot:XP_008618635.1 adenosylmethionine decarboxylase [Saprolegnia diclina VS20]